MRVDIHQHLWTESLLDALTERKCLPFVRRVDDLPIVSSAVFWPRQGTPGSELTGTDPFPTSDHRLVRVDLQVTT